MSDYPRTRGIPPRRRQAERGPRTAAVDNPAPARLNQLHVSEELQTPTNSAGRRKNKKPARLLIVHAARLLLEPGPCGLCGFVPLQLIREADEACQCVQRNVRQRGARKASALCLLMLNAENRGRLAHEGRIFCRGPKRTKAAISVLSYCNGQIPCHLERPTCSSSICHTPARALAVFWNKRGS